MVALVWERVGVGKRGFIKQCEECEVMGYDFYFDCGDISWVGLPDLSSENTRHPTKFEFQIKNIF